MNKHDKYTNEEEATLIFEMANKKGYAKTKEDYMNTTYISFVNHNGNDLSLVKVMEAWFQVVCPYDDEIYISGFLEDCLNYLDGKLGEL